MGAGMTTCIQDSSEDKYDAWKTPFKNVHPLKILVKIVFLITPVNPEEPVKNTKTCKQIPEFIIHIKSNTETGRQNEKNTQAKNDHTHAIIHYGSSQTVTPVATVLILFFGHEHSFISDGQYTEKA